MPGEKIVLDAEESLVKIYKTQSQKDEKVKTKRKYSRKIPAGKFFKRIQERTEKKNTAILPYGTKYYFKCGNTQIFVIEQLPQVRTITWFGYDEEEDKDILHSFKLAFPFVVALFAFQNGCLANNSPSIFYRNSPLKSLNSKLFHTNLPNVCSEYGDLCLGGVRIFSYGKNSIQIVNESMAALWNTEFNDGISWSDFRHFLDSHPQFSFAKWQKKTEKNPKSILRVKWAPAGKLISYLEELLEYVMNADSCLKDGQHVFDDDIITNEMFDAIYFCKEAD